MLERMRAINKGKGAMHTACLFRSLCKLGHFKWKNISANVVLLWLFWFYQCI